MVPYKGAVGKKVAWLILFLFLHGPIAQLVERLICNEEVVGSKPTGSTRKVVASMYVLLQSI